MAGAPEWTNSENLAIYMFLEKYPHKSSEEIAEEIFNNSLQFTKKSLLHT
ncbi:hypothetical protein V6669_13585 [Paenibacillus sp. Y5S-9]